MGIFDFLKNKQQAIKPPSSGSYFESEIEEQELKNLVNNAILIFQDNPGADHNEIIEKIKSHRDDEALALALYRFIPIAYCRLLLPEPKYSDQYILFKSENDQKEFSFRKDKIYQSVFIACQNRLANEPSEEKILPILFHSADFKAINEALNNGSELKNLECSPSFFL